MILGLYEAHLPVKNLAVSIDFYSKLGLDFVKSISHFEEEFIV